MGRRRGRRAGRRWDSLRLQAAGAISASGTVTVRWSDLEITLERPIRIKRVSLEVVANSTAPGVISTAILRADKDTVAVIPVFLVGMQTTRRSFRLPAGTDFMVVPLASPVVTMQNRGGPVTYVVTVIVELGANFDLKVSWIERDHESPPPTPPIIITSPSLE